MDSLKKLLTDSLGQIEEVTDLLYKQEVTLGYQKLNIALGTITNTINSIFAYKAAKEGFEIDEKNLVDNLTNALQAMEAKDTILLADILQYDLKEQLMEISKSI